MSEFYNDTKDLEYVPDPDEIAKEQAYNARMERERIESQKEEEPKEEVDPKKEQLEQRTQEQFGKSAEEFKDSSFIENVGAGFKNQDASPLGLATAASMGAVDFGIDAASALVPGLRGFDNWWDDTTEFSNPVLQGTRKAASVIIPTIKGTALVKAGIAKAGIGAQLPGKMKLLGEIALSLGIDTAVVGVASHSKTDHNLAHTLNESFGWNIPWATRDGMGQDEMHWYNVMENMGFAAGGEFLGLTLNMLAARRGIQPGTKLIPKTPQAEEAITFRKISNIDELAEPEVKDILKTRKAREDAITEEGLRRLNADPDGSINGYDAFINEPAEFQARAMGNQNVDPIKAKVDEAQIQGNIDTLNGRPSPVASETFRQALNKTENATERALKLRELFAEISPQVDAVTSTGKKIPSKQINQAVDNLAFQLFRVPPAEFAKTLNQYKKIIYEGQQFLDPESYVLLSQAFKTSFDNILDPNNLRASAMITQMAGGNAADAAKAAEILEGSFDVTRQHEYVFDNLETLGKELRTNGYIADRLGEMNQLAKSKNPEEVVKWLDNEAVGFEEGLQTARQKGANVISTLKGISKKNPEYLQPIFEEIGKSNGNVDELFKLNRYLEEKIGIISKGFIDGNPQVPSSVIEGINGVRRTNMLLGTAPIKALAGNMILTTAKPVSILAGSYITGDTATFKRAMYTFGGIQENFNRALKHMASEWRYANSNPYQAAQRGRGDLRLAKMAELQILETQQEKWLANKEYGKYAATQLAKMTSWWNNNKIARSGINALYAVDGFLGSMMTSGATRAKAYDELFSATNGKFSDEAFSAKANELYSQAFDKSGLITDKSAKFQTAELALNLDNKVVQDLEVILDRFPVLKSIVLFPRTSANAFELAYSYSPTSGIGLAVGRVRKVMKAKTTEEMQEALLEHGLEFSQAAFDSLKAEYTGRHLMGSMVVTGTAMLAFQGLLTGNGSHDDAERMRMERMGFKPKSIQLPNGQWISYEGLEPFDMLMGLTADVVRVADRVDSSVTEDLLRKLSVALTMNVTNQTFLGSLQPIVDLLSRHDATGARFLATQADQMIPGTGARSLLNRAISPQLKDFEREFTGYFANKWKFLFSGNEYLKDYLDVYTGEPIRYYEQPTATLNALLPFFKTNGGMEPWRQWLLETEWDGLNTYRKNPYTNQDLTPEERQFINNHVAQNGNLIAEITRMMNRPDKFWDNKMKAYTKGKGNLTQKELPIKKLAVHKQLDAIHKRAFDDAWEAYILENSDLRRIDALQQRRDYKLQIGDVTGAVQDAQQVKQLIEMRK